MIIFLKVKSIFRDRVKSISENISPIRDCAKIVVVDKKYIYNPQ